MKRLLRKIVFHSFHGSMMCIAMIGIMISSGQALGGVSLMQQSVLTVNGTVTGIDNQSIPGVNIIVKGTTTGTVTDADGKYVLTVPDENATLVFSYIGFLSEEIAIQGKTLLDVSMSPDIATLSEIVVVGYGQQERASVTGAISELKGAELVKSQAPNITNSLAGRIAGVISIQRNAEPGDDAAEILIRGRATLNDNGPLVMVDGIQRRINEVDPNDVATISVLKDAAATAIYGTRGANGVILISTKKGKSGKPTFAYNGYVGVQNVVTRPNYLRSYDYARLYNQAALNDDPSLTADDLPYSAEDLQNYKDGSSPYTHPDVDWWDEIITPNAPQQRHSMSMNGGSENFKFYISLGYLDQAGFFRTQNSKRYNGRINVDANLTKSTTVSIGLGGDAGRWERPGIGQSRYEDGIFGVVSYLAPNAFPVKNEDGTWSSTYYDNPVAFVAPESGKRDERPTNLQTTFTINQSLDFLTDGLTFKLVGAYDLGYTNSKRFVKYYTAYNNSTGEQFGPYPSELYEDFSRYNNNTFETHLNYARTFDQHQVSALLMYTQTSYYSNSIDGSRTGFATPAVQQLLAGPRTDIDNNSGASEAGREGILGRLAYSYNEKYFVEGSFGFNGSDNFPSGKKFGFFPAISLKWNLKQERFLDNATFLSNLSLRGSYGEVGNDRMGDRRFLYQNLVAFGDSYVFGGSNPTPAQTLRSMGMANPNVTWEKAQKTNFAVDADFFNSKIGFTLDVFNENRNNILALRNASVPLTFGAQLPVQNIAKVTNRGFDGEVRYKNNVGAFSYFINATYTYARNEVKYIDEAENIPSYRKREGHPIGQFYGYVVEGMYKTQEQIDSHPKFEGIEPKLGQFMYKDIGGPDGVPDGIIDKQYDVTAIGKSQTPQNIYGLNVGASFKGFDLSMLWQGATGYNVMRAGENFVEFSYDGNALSQIKDNWTPENPNASYPRLSLIDYSYKQEESSFWLKEAGYLRLRSLEVGYSIPQTLFKKTSITKLRVYVSGTNLLTFSKEKDFDPESASGAPWFYPVTRLTSVGLNLIF